MKKEKKVQINGKFWAVWNKDIYGCLVFPFTTPPYSEECQL